MSLHVEAQREGRIRPLINMFEGGSQLGLHRFSISTKSMAFQRHDRDDIQLRSDIE